MPIVYLGAGSNLGDRLGNLQTALACLRENPALSGLEVSRIYETAPVGYPDQGDFLNCVARVHTDLSPYDVLEICRDIEKRMERVRAIRFGPRNIDVDVLFYDACIINTPNLQIPHPRLHTRKFVLKPMCDLQPDFVHPLLQKSMAQLLAALGDDRQAVEEYVCSGF